MRYPILIQIQWWWTTETILIEEPKSPASGAEFTTSEVWPEPPFQVDYVTNVTHHEIVGSVHELKLDYRPENNLSIRELTDCFGCATIKYDTSGRTKNKAKWENDPPNADYDGEAKSVKIIPAGGPEFLGFTTSLRRKRKQGLFKSRLLRIEHCCALTGETEQSVLEAAHIVEVQDNGGYGAHNGFLLRSDVHRLFDKRLLRIDPQSGKAQLSDEIPKNSDYHTQAETWILKDTIRRRVKKSLLKRAKIGC